MDNPSPPPKFWETLASKVGPGEAGLLVLAGIIWIVVLACLPKVSDLVGIVLLVLAALLTAVILLIMHIRTPIVRHPRSSAGSSERTDAELLTERPSREEYLRSLSERRSSGKGEDH